MIQWSPTSLNVYGRNCPYAVKLYQQQRDGEYEVEGAKAACVGIAQHAMLHAAGAARQKDEPAFGPVEATAIALAQVMNPAYVWEAKDAALEFIRDWEFPKCMKFEHGVAFDPQWVPVEWDSPARRLRMIFDAVGVSTYDHEVYGRMTVAWCQDYKTGWHVTAHELDSVQMDCAACALRSLYPDVDGIRLDIVATRFNRVHTKILALSEEEDAAEFRMRKQRVKLIMDAGDQSEFKARTGFGCLRCNYCALCPAFSDAASNVKTHALSPRADTKEIAHFYAIAKALGGEAEEALRVRTEGSATFIDNGRLGFSPTTKRAVKDGKCLCEIWERATGQKLTDDARNFVRGLLGSMKIGMTQFDSAVGAAAEQLGYETKRAAIAAESVKYCCEVQGVEWGWTPETEKRHEPVQQGHQVSSRVDDARSEDGQGQAGKE